MCVWVAIRGLHLAGNDVMVDSQGYVVPRSSMQAQLASNRNPTVPLNADMAMTGTSLVAWGRHASASAETLRRADRASAANTARLGEEEVPSPGDGGKVKTVPSGCTMSQVDAVASQSDSRIMRTCVETVGGGRMDHAYVCGKCRGLCGGVRRLDHAYVCGNCRGGGSY